MRDRKTARLIKKAAAVQRALKGSANIRPLEKLPATVAGVDAAYSDGAVIVAACLYTYPELRHLQDAVLRVRTEFPYIPGYLSFREGPAVIEALASLGTKPDLILLDGQGIAHPERMGIATHVGMLTGIPSVGCAKSRLVGTYREPGLRKGSRSMLIYKEETVGAVLRTRDGVKPLFVSPGHLIDLEGAVEIVMKCIGRYRLPEPLRRADIISKHKKMKPAKI